MDATIGRIRTLPLKPLREDDAGDHHLPTSTESTQVAQGSAVFTLFFQRKNKMRASKRLLVCVMEK